MLQFVSVLHRRRWQSLDFSAQIAGSRECSSAFLFSIHCHFVTSKSKRTCRSCTVLLTVPLHPQLDVSILPTGWCCIAEWCPVLKEWVEALTASTALCAQVCFMGCRLCGQWPWLSSASCWHRELQALALGEWMGKYGAQVGGQHTCMSKWIRSI